MLIRGTPGFNNLPSGIQVFSNKSASMYKAISPLATGPVDITLMKAYNIGRGSSLNLHPGQPVLLKKPSLKGANSKLNSNKDVSPKFH